MCPVGVKVVRFLLALATVGLLSIAASKDLGPRGNDHLRDLLVAGQWDEALKLAQLAARWPDHANGSEGLIQTNAPILLDWDVCASRGGTNPAPALHPQVCPYPWLEFGQATNSLNATLHLRAASWPKTAWRIRLQQVDRAGAFVIVRRQAERITENSGTIERIPLLENLEAAFHLNRGAELDAPQGALYQISIETAWTEQGNPVRWGEAVPLTLDLPTAEHSRVFSAESLKLEPASDPIQARVQAEVICWPKSRWRLALELSDANGKTVGRGEQTVANTGAILSRPSWSHAPFQITIPGAAQSLAAARRWTLRIESLGPEPRDGK